MKSSASKKSETKPTETHDCPECGRHFGSMAGVLGHSWTHKYPKRSPSLRGGVKGPSTEFELHNPVEVTAPKAGIICVAKRDGPSNSPKLIRGRSADTDEAEAPPTTKPTSPAEEVCKAKTKDKSGTCFCDLPIEHPGLHVAGSSPPSKSEPVCWEDAGDTPTPIHGERSPAREVAEAVQRFKDELPPLKDGSVIRVGSNDYKVEGGELKHVYFPSAPSVVIPEGSFIRTPMVGFYEVRDGKPVKLSDLDIASALAKMGSDGEKEAFGIFDPDKDHGDTDTEDEGEREVIKGPTNSEPSKDKGSHGLFDAEAAPPKMGEDSSAAPQSEATHIGLFEVDSP